MQGAVLCSLPWSVYFLESGGRKNLLQNFFFHKTKVAQNYEKIKVKISQTWPFSR